MKWKSRGILSVIPGRAEREPGIHNHRPEWFKSWSNDRPKPRRPGIMGSRLRGNDTNCGVAAFDSHIRCIDTETFGPFLIV